MADSKLEEKILADSKLEQVCPTTQQGELMAPALVQAENAEQPDTSANSTHHMDSVYMVVHMRVILDIPQASLLNIQASLCAAQNQQLTLCRCRLSPFKTLITSTTITSALSTHMVSTMATTKDTVTDSTKDTEITADIM